MLTSALKRLQFRSRFIRVGGLVTTFALLICLSGAAQAQSALDGLVPNAGRIVEADTNIGSIATGDLPRAVAVNPVTNLTVFDGTNSSTVMMT
jgi:hypothetical protein